MTTRKAIDIIDAVKLLAETLDETPSRIIASVCFFDEKKEVILTEATDKYNEFVTADIEDKGKMLGIEITEIKA